MGLPGAESKATRPLAQDFGEAHRRHSGTNGEPPGLAFGKPEDRLREAVRIRQLCCVQALKGVWVRIIALSETRIFLASAMIATLGALPASRSLR